LPVQAGADRGHPAIRPYDEAAWAMLSDSAKIPINISLTLLYALHTRWYSVISDMDSAPIGSGRSFIPNIRRR
jgi:hypothetical protein